MFEVKHEFLKRMDNSSCSLLADLSKSKCAKSINRSGTLKYATSISCTGRSRSRVVPADTQKAAVPEYQDADKVTPVPWREGQLRVSALPAVVVVVVTLMVAGVVAESRELDRLHRIGYGKLHYLAALAYILNGLG